MLVFDALNVESPHWSPDASRIVLALDWQVSIMNRDGSGLRQYDAPGDVLRSTVWSPDGRRILYFSSQTGWRLVSPDFTDEGPSGGPLADLNADPDWQPIPAPRRADYKNQSAFCGAERDFLGEQQFRAKYGRNGNGANAFGKCVSGK